MSTNENIIVRILTEWKGRQSLNNAKTDLSSFEAGALKLGKTLAGVFAAQKIAQFGNASLKAFTADNLAAKQLALTLTNLGLGFDSKRVEDYIQATEKLTGVLDDQLRPAMQLFLNTTGSVARSQSMLNTALNISRATGKDLTSVSTALARAYQGNYTSLQRLGIGVDVATMKTQGFSAVQDTLNAKFAGAAKTAADSYQGSLDKLKVAADNAKEAIGKGMVDALSALSSSGTIDGAVKAIEKVSTAFGHAIAAVGRFVAWNKVYLSTGWTVGADEQAKLDAIYAPKVVPQTRGAGRLAVQVALDRAAAEKKVTDAIKAKAMADAKANAALLKQKSDQLKIDQASALLKKTQSIFDLQAIEIAAALQNDKITADERLRLQMLQTADMLAEAIQNKDIAAIDALSSKLKDLTQQFKDLEKLSLDPFANGLATLKLFNAELSNAMAMAFQLSIISSGINVGGYYGLSQQYQDSNPSLAAVYDSAALAADAGAAAAAIDALNTLLDPVNTAIDAAIAAAEAATLAASGGSSTLNVTLDPGLLGTLQNKIVDNTASGSPSTIARNQALAW